MWNRINRLHLTLCGLKCINWINQTVKILGCHFSYNKTLQQENNFKKHTSEIVSILKVWIIRHLNLEGNINVYKSLLF